MIYEIVQGIPDITKLDTLVLPAWSGELPHLDMFNSLGNGFLQRLWARASIRVMEAEVKILYLEAPWPNVVIVGLGDRTKFTPERARMSGASLVNALADLAAVRVLVAVERIWPPEAEGLFIGALVEGMLLGSYRFDRYKSSRSKQREKQIIQFMGAPELVEYVNRAVVLAGTVNLARDLVNEPSNTLTPRELARRSLQLAREYNLQGRVLDCEGIAKLGMGGLLGIARGSAEMPKLITLSYNGGESYKKITFVGKGITFDAGGISLKPARGMRTMKSDMAGGAAVIAALAAIAKLQLRINVTGIIPAAENMPDGSALKPGDIIKMSDGTTVEIVNTDAEGRLILADALAYANQLGTDVLIDVATLSAACSIALGPVYSGLWSNNHDLQQTVLRAAECAGEKFWPMPYDQEYYEEMKSSWADLRNAAGDEGNANNAAAFLRHFAGVTPWVHLDIAPTGYADSAWGYIKRGGTGVAVRTLVHLAGLLAD